MCYAHSGPGGTHLSYEQCIAAIDRLVEVEGRPEVLQLSGGEPTIHPQFLDVLDYACAQPIDVVMINTNGIRFAHDGPSMRRVAEQRHRLELYFQFDGFDDAIYETLRGEKLLDVKLRALDALGQHGIRTTLVTTLQPDVNEDQIGRIVQFGLERPWITGISFQPATYSGRFVLPEQLEKRITFPDVVERIVDQSDGLFRTEDFMPLPCASELPHAGVCLSLGTRRGAARAVHRRRESSRHPGQRHHVQSAAGAAADRAVSGQPRLLCRRQLRRTARDWRNGGARARAAW